MNRYRITKTQKEGVYITAETMKKAIDIAKGDTSDELSWFFIEEGKFEIDYAIEETLK